MRSEVRPDSSPSAAPSEEKEYPSCQTTLWQIGRWRCEYWRPEGRWRGSSLRLFRGDRLVRTVGFGLRAREQSLTWRASVINYPTTDPAAFVDGNDDEALPPTQPTSIGTNKLQK